MTAFCGATSAGIPPSRRGTFAAQDPVAASDFLLPQGMFSDRLERVKGSRRRHRLFAASVER